MTDRENASESNARRLTLLYVTALSTVALLSIGAQWLIQRQLQTGDSDSHVINVAGRQRMLSQRLAKATLRIDAALGDDKRRATEELTATLADWSANHRGLREGDPALGLPGENGVQVLSLFDSIQPHYVAMSEAALKISRGAGDVDALQAIQAHEGAFLTGMDAIVSQLVAEAEGRVERLRWLERTLLGLTLLVLLSEGLFVFRPAVQRIKQSVRSLETVGQELQAAKEDAEAANDAKSQFLANVSHELRTPMTAVLGMTELARDATDEPARNRYLEIVEEASESLMRLLNDLIDIARIEAGELTLVSTPFRANETTDKAARLLKPLADAKGIRLVAAPAAEEPCVLGDEQRLMQVLVNLIGNAIKWTDSGSVTISCRVEPLSEEDRQLVWRVEDTGAGVSQADQRRVFEPFSQAEAGAKRGGAGLGLAICRRIVEAMGGSIELTSELGEGTSVQFRIPLQLSESLPECEAETPNATDTKAERLQVLVVEDTEVNQLLIQEILERSGHSVVIEEDGRRAIELFSQNEFHVVLTDLRLEGIDGVEVAARIRAIAADRTAEPPRIVCVTADADAAMCQANLASFDAVLTKPFRRDQLLSQVFSGHGAAPGDPVKARPAPAQDQELLVELAAVLRETLPSQISELQTAAADRDYASILMLAHRLRGQVGYFDCRELESELTAIEQAAGREDDARTAMLCGRIFSQLDEFLEFLPHSESAP